MAEVVVRVVPTGQQLVLERDGQVVSVEELLVQMANDLTVLRSSLVGK